jgi:hypothetical protein
MTGAWRLLWRVIAVSLTIAALAVVPGSAQEAGGATLTISGMICPEDYAGGRFADECAAVPAAGAQYQVRNTGTGAMLPPAGGFVTANDQGVVVFEDLGALAPGTVQILAMAPEDGGMLRGYSVPEVACDAAGNSAPRVDLIESAFTGRIVEIAATPGADLRCHVYFVPQTLVANSEAADAAAAPATEAPRSAAGSAQVSWLDGARAGWNVPGAPVPAPPAPAGSENQMCQGRDRPAETAEDEAVTAQGWRLYGGYERGRGITLIGGFLDFDGMCRPVYYQQFVFVDGVFAGTLAPQPMVPRTDGALRFAGISAADGLYAVYSRYAPDDALCCPSGETVVAYSIERTDAGPVVTPYPGQSASASVAPARQEVAGDTTTTAVCVGLGGDALSLDDWTAEEIATQEARTGPVARAHPATGTCRDPAGLPVGAGDARAAATFSWVCLPTASGGWYGPVWTADIYLPDEARLPNPAIGGCPLPRDASVPPRPATEQAAATAVYLSQLEAADDLETLYDWLHPDAQAVVPKEAVVGWYTAEWLPRRPGPIRVTDVETGEWTWPVTGETYAHTATVAYEQPFADGTIERDVVRLVQDEQGLWRWFFGRDRTFVDEQIARFAG